MWDKRSQQTRLGWGRGSVRATKVLRGAALELIAGGAAAAAAAASLYGHNGTGLPCVRATTGARSPNTARQSPTNSCILFIPAAASFGGGSANAELATAQNGVARSLTPNALFQNPPKTLREEEEEMGLPSGETQFRAPARSRLGHGRAREGLNNPSTLQGEVQI